MSCHPKKVHVLEATAFPRRCAAEGLDGKIADACLQISQRPRPGTDGVPATRQARGCPTEPRALGDFSERLLVSCARKGILYAKVLLLPRKQLQSGGWKPQPGRWPVSLDRVADLCGAGRRAVARYCALPEKWASESLFDPSKGEKSTVRGDSSPGQMPGSTALPAAVSALFPPKGVRSFHPRIGTQRATTPTAHPGSSHAWRRSSGKEKVEESKEAGRNEDPCPFQVDLVTSVQWGTERPPRRASANGSPSCAGEGCLPEDGSINQGR
jgi:hypothetical protein